MSKSFPPPLEPWYVRWAWDTWTWITWPLQARQLKRQGFRKTGFMTYELGPADDPGKSRTTEDNGGR